MNNFCLSKMINVSNNSMLTHQVAKMLITKLTANELRDFNEWLKIVDNNTQQEVGRMKRRTQF